MKKHKLMVFIVCTLSLVAANAFSNDYFSPADGTYIYKGTEWNSAWNGDVDISIKMTVKKLADLPNGQIVILSLKTAYPSAVKKTEFESMIPSGIDLMITKDYIYELEENQIGQYLDTKETPQVSKESVRCQNKSLKEEKLLETTHVKIDVTPEKCDFYWWHDDGSFSTFKWEKGKGLVELAGGYGAHISGFRLKLIDKPKKRTRN